MHREHKPLHGTTLDDLLPDRVASFPLGRCKFIFSSKICAAAGCPDPPKNNMPERPDGWKLRF
jgi:hypothetical protein